MSSSSRFYRAVFSSSLGTGISRIFGLFRTQAISAFLGASAVADAWEVAWTIPNMFRRFVADEGLTGALIPAVARAEAEEGVERARIVANTTLSFLLVLCLTLVAGMVLFSEQAVLLVALSFRDNPEQLALAVWLLRLTAPLLAFVSMVSFAEGLLNHRNHYFVPKVAPGLLALCMVLGVTSAGWLGFEPVQGLGVGTLLGGAAHLLVQVPVLRSHWGPVWPGRAFSDPRFRHVARELSKVLAIGLLAQLNIVVLRQLTTSIGDGVTLHYVNATRLVDLAQGIIAVGIGSALLPALSKAAAARDEAALGIELTRALRLAGFLLLPAAMVLLTFGLPVTSLLLRLGQYTMADVQQTAWTVAVMTPFMLSVAGINLLKKVFFAYDWRNALLGVGAVGVLLTAGLGVLLKLRWGLLGVTAALSMSTSVQLLLYAWLLSRWLDRRVRVDGLADGLGRMFLATLPVGLWLLACSRMGHWEAGPFSLLNWAVVACGLAVSGAVYALASQGLGIDEWRRVSELVQRRLRR